MSDKGEEEKESGTFVSHVLSNLSSKTPTPPAPRRSNTRPRDVLETIPSDAGTLPNGSFDSFRFQFETGLSPVEYVGVYLEANGPRVRQQTLVRSLEWSDATVCRLLQSMEEDGAVERCLLGREKIICLPGTAPAPPEKPSPSPSLQLFRR